ncbi:MAG: beta-ketoacyl-ACP synthase II [Agathobaculum sp.]|uniref:beta-ketoacyl-ACP synthase II n=1 Tax=Agathobaculum sp. TaxID=2048138 RepID=UPI0025C3AFF7|nr:beta-ketoacyl-ACP synthase II [Agathobaculum sp.]MDY3712036.1 beta-ketoacyl-ACP synthase II [Agathobaculum sp.]
MERVVITGMGAITPVGNDVESYWAALKAGKCGIGPITRFDASEFKVKLAAEVKDFDVTQYVDKREARRMDANCHFALAAAQQAVDQAGLKEGSFDPYRVGVIFGSGVGGLHVTEEEIPKLNEKGPGRVSPLCIPEMIANMAAAYISMRFGFRGENFCPVSACATGNHAIGEAMRAIRHGYQDVVVCGGTENGIIPISMAGFQNMKAVHLGDDPSCASIPFDARRSGFVMGEGAGCLVLESLTHAQARGAAILAEVAGYGATGDAYHITSPDPACDTAARAIANAIADAGLTPADVDYINAHGTSTPLNEKYETLAIKKAFGEAARQVKVSSTKSMTGHLLGGAAAIEAVACVMAIRDGVVPPTIGYEQPDPECDLDVTPNQAVSMPVRVAISNSLGFGGHNACILFKKV